MPKATLDSASLRYVVGGVDRYGPEWDWLPFRPNPPAHVHVEQLGAGQTLSAKLIRRSTR